MLRDASGCFFFSLRFWTGLFLLIYSLNDRSCFCYHDTISFGWLMSDIVGTTTVDNESTIFPFSNACLSKHATCQTRNPSENDIFEVYLHDNELPIQLYAPELLARNAIHQQNTLHPPTIDRVTPPNACTCTVSVLNHNNRCSARTPFSAAAMCQGLTSISRSTTPRALANVPRPLK